MLAFPGKVGTVNVPMVALHEGCVAEHELAARFGAGNGLEGSVDFAVVFQDRELAKGFSAGFAHVHRRCHAVGTFLVITQSMKFEKFGVAKRARIFGALLFVRLMLLQF